MRLNRKLLFGLLVSILFGNFLFYAYIMTKLRKVVVFDLDETLGHFVELGMFWGALENYYKKKLPISKFFETMDIFPEFLRPHIFEILKYLIKQKKRKECHKVIIYTNNQGPKSWTEMISKYFNWKLGYKVFDKVIASFKIDGNQIEMCRTSHSKKYTDLLRCSKLPDNTRVCFLDDQYHPHMDDKRVFYINSKPYVHELSYHESLKN